MTWQARLGRLLPFSPSTTRLQATTYLLGISLFSISFLVFLNSTVSFVITDLLGIKRNVGGIVGTLGFVDEIVALVFCPAWGLLSDRLGVRWVAVCGYTIISLALFVFVNTAGVGGLIVARIVFALGASAAATMVTATLPVLTDDEPPQSEESMAGQRFKSSTADGCNGSNSNNNPRCSVQTVESDATITPERFVRSLSSRDNLRGGNQALDAASVNSRGRKSSTLAGYVGLFTGCGALVALIVFLPLPAQFSKRDGVTPAQAVQYSFYVVAVVSLVVAVFVLLGLRGLPGEHGKGWRALFHLQKEASSNNNGHDNASGRPLPYQRLLMASLRLGATDPDIALAYLGGFVARASTVAISLFVPLYINAFFISRGFCQGSPNDPSPELKKECRSAYVLSSILTGVAQLVALLCAPVFGYLNASSRASIAFLGRSGSERGAIRLPVLIASTCGVIGYAAFPQLPSPEFKDEEGRGGGGGVFVVVALLGISQIGAIVCSLGSLGRGVLSSRHTPSTVDESGEVTAAHVSASTGTTDSSNREGAETSPLLGHGAVHDQHHPRSADPQSGEITRVQLKGSIAGIYSWCGGAAILLLTKLGGYLFDVTSRGAPFYMMAVFNGLLFVASLAIDIGAVVLEKRRMPSNGTMQRTQA